MFALNFFKSSDTLGRRAFDVLDLKLSVLSLPLHLFLKLIKLIFLYPDCGLRVDLKLLDLVFERLL